MRIQFYSPFLPDGLKDALAEVIDSGWLSQGAKVKAFEEKFCEKLGVKHAVALNSCTSALRLSYAIAGVGPGDEVITTPYTMMATNTAILEQFATPVFADVNYETGNIDVDDVEHRITDRTKAIVCVHFSGYPCDMDRLRAISREDNLSVIEDCAHALGAKYHGSPIGASSDYACFSFHACKHITTGDGGMFVTSDESIYKSALRRRWFGMDREKRRPTILGYPDFDVTEVGYKLHMNELAAAMGLEQLKHFDYVLEKRKAIDRFYREELAGVKDLTLFERLPDRESGHWLFPLHVKRRRKFAEKMLSKGIEVSIVFRRNDIYTVFGPKRKDLPNMDELDKDAICIPLHCDLTPEQTRYIVETIKSGW